MITWGKQAHPVRLVFLIALIVLWSALILGRLTQLQIIQHDEHARRARDGREVTRPIPAPRGVIYDGHMDELATSVPVSTVAAEPCRISDVPAAARNLSAILGFDPSELQARMMDPSHQTYQVIKRRIDPKAESRIEALGIDGVYLVEENLRVYPNRSLASHVLGFVNMNGDGGAGTELEYDKDLKGKEGLATYEVDGRRRSFRGETLAAPTQGHSLVLSIDKSIQYVTERELALAVESRKASSGTAIVMESDTGRIIALAIVPDFNCNSYNEYPAKLWRNQAVSLIFEPGSTFKVVVAAAALEAGLARPDEGIDCQMGSITIGHHVFRDHKAYGLLTFLQILENSSNVGAAKLGLRLGERRLYEALRRYGFGSKTGIDLPGESPGLVRDWREWSGLSIGAISFGQEVGVTSVQILAAINAIANDGYLVRPSIVDRVISQSGDLIRVRPPERTRIISSRTAATVREGFEGVVIRGTGQRAALEGYRAAGKTGTAQKIVARHYSPTKYVASFIGFAPLPSPRITVLVQIDEPQGAIYGGDVAAPVFRKIAQEALLQLHVPPDRTQPMPKFNPTLAAVSAEDFIPNATPVAPLSAMSGDGPPAADEQQVIRVRVGTGSVVLPDFTGLAKRTVIERCRELRIELLASGAGLAVQQLPPAGSVVPEGEVCKVTFARNASGHIAAAGTKRDPAPGTIAGGTAVAAIRR